MIYIIGELSKSVTLSLRPNKNTPRHVRIKAKAPPRHLNSLDAEKTGEILMARTVAAPPGRFNKIIQEPLRKENAQIKPAMNLIEALEASKVAQELVNVSEAYGNIFQTKQKLKPEEAQHIDRLYYDIVMKAIPLGSETQKPRLSAKQAELAEREINRLMTSAEYTESPEKQVGASFILGNLIHLKTAAKAYEGDKESQDALLTNAVRELKRNHYGVVPKGDEHPVGHDLLNAALGALQANPLSLQRIKEVKALLSPPKDANEDLKAFLEETANAFEKKYLPEAQEQTQETVKTLQNLERNPENFRAALEAWDGQKVRSLEENLDQSVAGKQREAAHILTMLKAAKKLKEVNNQDDKLLIAANLLSMTTNLGKELAKVVTGYLDEQLSEADKEALLKTKI